MAGAGLPLADAAASAGAGRPVIVGLAVAAVVLLGRGGALAVAGAVAAGRGGGRAGAEGKRRDAGDGGADQTGAELKHGVTSGAGVESHGQKGTGYGPPRPKGRRP